MNKWLRTITPPTKKILRKEVHLRFESMLFKYSSYYMRWWALRPALGNGLFDKNRFLKVITFFMYKNSYLLYLFIYSMLSVQPIFDFIALYVWHLKKKLLCISIFVEFNWVNIINNNKEIYLNLICN
jgi:hypothetical protein